MTIYVIIAYLLLEYRWCFIIVATEGGMSRYLSTILGVGEAQLAHSIKKLEQATLNKSTDVRLVAEIRTNLRHRIAQLGLDPHDTTAEELYLALQAKVQQDNRALQKKVGIKDTHSSVESLHKLAEYFAKSHYSTEVWGLKKSALKKLLAAHVPHKTMKVLHYRSQASMFKRESPASIYATALLLEGKTYKEKMITEMRKLSPQDFEMRKVEIISFAPTKWEAIHKSLKKNIVPVYALPEVNGVVVIPIKTQQTGGLVLLATALILTELYRVKAHASFLKISSLNKDLAAAVQDLAKNDKVTVTTAQGIEVTWHHVHRLLASSTGLAEAIGPHLTQQDVQWISVEAALTGICPELEFWVGSHHVAFASDNHVVSLHILDVALNALYHQNISAGSLHFVRQSLHDELLLRYLEQPPFIGVIAQYLQKVTDASEVVLYD
jgi:hypothetical protein